MNDLIQLLEKEIQELDNKIEFEQIIPRDLKIIENIFTEENIYQMDNAIFEYIEYLKNYGLILTQPEINFIMDIANLKPETRSFLGGNIGLTPQQRAVMLNIKRKIETLKNNFVSEQEERYNHEKDKCKKIILNLKNPQLEFISDLEFIKDILDKNNVPIMEQTKILLEVNSVNARIYSSLLKSKENDEEEAIETNLDENQVIAIFNSFGLDFNKIYSKDEKNKNKLLKYGESDKIKNLLQYVNNETRLNFVFKKSELLTKILLHSSVKEIQDVIDLSDKKGIPGAISKLPSILFPISRNYVRIHGSISPGPGTVPGPGLIDPCILT